MVTHVVSPAGRRLPCVFRGFYARTWDDWTGRKRAICQNARFRSAQALCLALRHSRPPRSRVRAQRLRTTDLASGSTAASAGDRCAAGQAHRHRLGRVHRPLRGGRGGAGAPPRRRLRQLRRVPGRRDRASGRPALRHRPAPVRGGGRAGGRPALRRPRQGGARQARARPRPEPGPDQRGLRAGRRPAPPGLAGRARRRDPGRRRAEGRPAQHRVHPCDRAAHRPRQPPSRQPRQSRAGQRHRHVDAADLDRLARPDLRLFRHG